MDTDSMAQQHLRDGDPEQALRLLEQQVRAAPEDPGLRVFLFQLLAVLGQWQRARDQAEAAARLDPGALALARVYGAALDCEQVRARVFAGERAPLVFGEPLPWLALLVEALRCGARGQLDQARQLRAQAFDQATPAAGTLDARPFGWIADADARLGPVLEAIVGGQYYWMPFTRLRAMTLEAPHDLRDLVWMPAQFVFDNGGTAAGLIPARYPGSETAAPALALARRTEWREGGGAWQGLGQRMLATDAGEAALFDVRHIAITGAPPAQP